MFEFILGCIVLIVAVIGFAAKKKLNNEGINSTVIIAVSSILLILGLFLSIHSTTLYVEDNEGGLIIRKFGSDLTDGHIVAANGEKGPQAKVLPPGWHFFYWPWLYELEPIENKTIPQGKVGVVVALDGDPLNDKGTPLSEQNIYAPEWDSPTEMLDGEKFLEKDENGKSKGKRGPQLTVLTPGQYRYNDRLFKIEIKNYLSVAVGEVAVVKSNVGPQYIGKDVEEVNGTPIVPQGFRGIWNESLKPNEYYLHPDAYEYTFLKTTNRVYSYTKSTDAGATSTDDSIGVRTMDGFEIPVDIRTNVKITAKNAPYVVALLGDPDSDKDGNGYDILEEKIILPTIRAIVRNSAETKGGLEYVQSRSEIEESVSKDFGDKLSQFKIDTDGIFIARIGLSDTEDGKELLKTQTEMEIATREIKTWEKKEEAEVARASQVKAAEDADQEKNKAQADAQIDIETKKALALVAKAEGERDAYKARIEALENVDNLIMIELATKFMEIAPDIKLPEVLVIGGGSDKSGSIEALIADLLKSRKVTPVKK